MTTKKQKTYSVWTNSEKDTLTLVEGTKQPISANGNLDMDASIKLYEIQATDYNSAMTKHHEIQGWKQYNPF